MLLPPRTATSQVRRRASPQHQINSHMKLHWRAHCHKTFGGFEWLCFLVALGYIGGNLVKLVHEVIDERVLEKTGRSATATPTPDARLSARAAAATRGEEVPPARGPAQRTSAAKRARDAARALEKRKRSPIVSCLHCG